MQHKKENHYRHLGIMARLQDAEIRKLCEGIIAGQQQEIDQMNEILRRLR